MRERRTRLRKALSGSNLLDCLAWGILFFEALSFLNLQGRVGNVRHADVVEQGVRRWERVHRFGCFENLGERLRLPA